MPEENPLRSVAAYGQLITELFDRPTIERSTVTVWSTSPFTGTAEGEIFFTEGYRLRIREELDFDEQRITSYGYEAYLHEERLYWYDDFPHPNDPTLASTHPHHKHVPPNIKRNRIPAPNLSFIQPNLPQIIQELENVITSNKGNGALQLQ